MKSSSPLKSILLALPFLAPDIGVPLPAVAAPTAELGRCVADSDDERPVLDCGGEVIDVRLELFESALARLRAREAEAINGVGLYEKYLAWIAPSEHDTIYNLWDLSAVLAGSYPELYSAFVLDADDVGDLGVPDAPRVEGGGASGALAVRAAAMQIMSGLARRVLVVGFEHTASHLPGADVQLLYALSFDADVDGMHIRNLLLTYFLRYFEELVLRGHVHILETPLYRVRNKKETRYCYSETERDQALEELSKPEMTRFKGLGEISPGEFKQFIAEGIRLVQVRIQAVSEVTRALEFYMGKNTPERKEFIADNLISEVV